MLCQVYLSDIKTQHSSYRSAFTSKRGAYYRYREHDRIACVTKNDLRSLFSNCLNDIVDAPRLGLLLKHGIFFSFLHNTNKDKHDYRFGGFKFYFDLIRK